MLGPCLHLAIVLHVMRLLAVLALIDRRHAVLLLHLHLLLVLLHLPGHALHPCTQTPTLRFWTLISCRSGGKRQNDKQLRGAGYLLACHNGPLAVA